MSNDTGALAGIQRQIMWNRLIAVVEEQAQVMIRTAFSTTVREAGDLSAGIFDMHGRMMAQAVTGTPGHVNSMMESVGHFLQKFPAASMKEGDHYITNDPWLGTGHLHDLTVVTPAFRNGKIVGLFANTAHVIDIGGLGMGPEGRSVFEEGLYIPIVKCFDQGKPNETFFDFIRWGSRLPVELEGDVYSLCAVFFELLGLQHYLGPKPSIDALLQAVIHAHRCTNLQIRCVDYQGVLKSKAPMRFMSEDLDV